MTNIWIVSDTHFGHSNIIKYCDRPFANADEMDQVLLENWNAVVKDQDIIYHLGDVYFSVAGRAVLPKLKGRKRLLLGNHDNGKDQALMDTFQKIGIWRKFPAFGLLLTHLPVHEGQLGGYVSPTKEEFVPGWGKNVHGHIHEKTIDDARYVNVSVEQTNYRPVNIEELRVTPGPV